MANTVPPNDNAAITESILAGQPEPPKYFAQMKRINKEGPAILNGFNHPPEVPVQRLESLTLSIAEKIINDRINVKLQLQIHKLIWKNKPEGVKIT